jgi:hypothetical protein
MMMWAGVTVEVITHLTQEVSALEAEYTTNRKVVEEHIRAINVLWDELGAKPASSFEVSVMRGVQSFVMSPDNMHALAALRTKVTLPMLTWLCSIRTAG